MMKRHNLAVLLIAMVALAISGCNSIEFHNQIVVVDVNPDLSGTVEVAITISEYDLNYLADYQNYSDPVAGLAGLVADQLGWTDYEYSDSTTEDGLRIVSVETSFDNASHLNTLLSQIGTTDGLDAYTTPYGDVYSFAIVLNPQQTNSARSSFLIRLPGTVNQSSGTLMDDGFYSWNATSGYQEISIATMSIPRFEAKYDINYSQDGSGKIDIWVGAESADMQEAISFYGTVDALGERIAEGHGLTDHNVNTSTSGEDEWITVSGRFNSSSELYEIMVDEAGVFESLNFFADSSFLTTDYSISGELAADVAFIGYPLGTTVNITTPGNIESTTGAKSSDNTVTWTSGDTTKTINLTSSSMNMMPFIVGGVCMLLGLGVVVVAVAGGGALMLRGRNKKKAAAPAVVIERSPQPVMERAPSAPAPVAVAERPSMPSGETLAEPSSPDIPKN